MAFRKTSYSKVFVDEAIPSFLARRPDTAVPLAPAQAVALPPVLQAAPFMSPRAASPAEAKPQAQPFVERRNRSLKVRPAFVAQLVIVALLLNALLYVALNQVAFFQPLKTHSFAQAGRVAAPIAMPASASSAEDAVVSYSIPHTPVAGTVAVSY